MNPLAPIFELLDASADAHVQFGTPLRVYSFGEVQGQPVQTPYLVWQNVAGVPNNTLADAPDTEERTTQVDVYAEQQRSVRDAATLARDILESGGYMIDGPRESKEPDTNLFRVSFDVAWILHR